MYKALSTGDIGVKADLARAAALAAKYGFAGLYVNIEEAATLGAARAKEILDAAGVLPAAFGLPLDYRQPEPEFVAALKRLATLCETARDLGITRTFTWVPSFHDELDFDANYAFHKDRFGRIAAILAGHGIRLGLEFLGPKTVRDGHKYAFIHSMDGMLKLCADIGTGNLGLLMDAYHWYTAHGAWADLERLTDADIVYVHVNDAPAGIPVDEQQDLVRTLPGETGVIGVPRFLNALAQIGYTGPVVVEPFSERVRAMAPEDAVRATAEALDAVWPKSGK
jgi:sugar phosphate isomerase/epimerase